MKFAALLIGLCLLTPSSFGVELSHFSLEPTQITLNIIKHKAFNSLRDDSLGVFFKNPEQESNVFDSNFVAHVLLGGSFFFATLVGILSFFYFSKKKHPETNKNELMDRAWSRYENNLTTSHPENLPSLSLESRDYLVKKYGVGIEQMTLEKAYANDQLFQRINKELLKGK
jgi:hypothetical protein